MVVCSTSFLTLGRAQLRALGCADAPIAVIPHPFGLRTREEVRRIAEKCADDIARLAVAGDPDVKPAAKSGPRAVARAASIAVASDPIAFNEECERRNWSDGLPLIAPTPERVEAMLRTTARAPTDIVARVAPGYGEATVERIAINAVMAGCRPEYLPIVIAAVEAVSEKRFNLQGIQATTNPVAPWIIINGPIVGRLNINARLNCLGQGRVGERDHRARAAPRAAEHRRRGARRNGPRNPRPAGQVHVLLRGKRSREPVARSARRARFRRERQCRHRRRRRRHAQHEFAREGCRRICCA